MLGKWLSLYNTVVFFFQSYEEGGSFLTHTAKVSWRSNLRPSLQVKIPFQLAFFLKLSYIYSAVILSKNIMSMFLLNTWYLGKIRYLWELGSHQDPIDCHFLSSIVNYENLSWQLEDGFLPPPWTNWLN